MKAESNIKPLEYTIEKYGDTADIIICENIVQEERDNGLIYTYDEYRLSVPYRDNLFKVVKNNLDAWTSAAKIAESIIPTPTISEEVATLHDKNSELDKLVNIMLGVAQNG